MSEIYAPDELTWHNRNEARVVRDYLVNLADLSDQEGEALWAEMASLSVADHHRVAEWLGLLQDKDSPWKDMRFGEFKAYLACYFGELEEALDWLAWCEDFGQIPPQRMNLLRSLALQVSAQLDAKEDYLCTAGLLYGEAAYQQGEHLLSGSWIWPSLTGSKAHEKLMVAKDKLMAHKQAYFDGGAHV
jgi:ribosomal protein S12 methylthiotransferase accessory factor